MNRFRSFFTTPFSVYKAVMLSFIFGLISPFIMRLLLPHNTSTWAFIIFTISILVMLYWRKDRSKFRKDKVSRVNSLCASILFFCVIPASVWCYQKHICEGGHMCHPPYPAWHYICDASWAIILVAISLWLCLMRSPVSIAIACIAAFLLSYRFVFGSFGGIYSIPL